jgi:WD40 repeat protein
VFSPGGDRIALLSKNGNVDVFDRASGRRTNLQQLLKRHLATRAVVFGRGGSVLAGATDDGTVWVIALGSTPRLVSALPGSRGGARSIAFNQSGTLVASGGADGSVTVASPLGGPAVAILLGHEGPVTSVAFDQTGRRLVTTSTDGTVRLWDLSLAAPQTFARPTVLAVDRTGRHAVTALPGAAGNAAVWDLATGTLFRTLRTKAGPLGVSQASFSDDGVFVATVGASGLPQLWDWRKGRAFDASAKAGAVPGLLQGIQVSPDGAAVAAIEGAGGTSVARVWRRDASGLTRTATLRARAPIRALAFSPDGLLATAAGNGVVLWDWRRAEKVGGAAIASADRRRPVSVIGVAFSPTGERFVLTGDDGVARVWDRRDSLVRADLEHNGLLFSDFGPTDDLVATAGADGVARVWDVNTKAPVATLYGGTEELAAATIGRDARTVVTIGFDRRGRIFGCDACARSTPELESLAAARLAPDHALLETEAAKLFGRENG